MIYYGYITNQGSILIIGTDEQEVEETYKDKRLTESHIEEQHVYRFKHYTENGKTYFGPYGKLTQYEKTVQEEVSKMGDLRIKIHVARIKELLRTSA